MGRVSDSVTAADPVGAFPTAGKSRSYIGNLKPSLKHEEVIFDMDLVQDMVTYNSLEYFHEAG